MKLYGLPGAPCTARVLLCLEEVGAEYELVTLSMPTGEHKGPAHLARNVRLLIYILELLKLRVTVGKNIVYMSFNVFCSTCYSLTRKLLICVIGLLAMFCIHPQICLNKKKEQTTYWKKIK